MGFNITEAELTLLMTGQAKVLIRQHDKVQWGVGVKVPLFLNPRDKSPIAVKIIGAIERDLMDVQNHPDLLKLTGFRTYHDFRLHWERSLYGPEGINKHAHGSKIMGGTNKIVVYRVVRDDFVQRRMRMVD